MPKSLALWLALVTARGARPAIPWPDPPAGDGPLVWVRPGRSTSLVGLAELAQHLRRSRPALRLLITPPEAVPDDLRFPPEVAVMTGPADARLPVRSFLDRMRPSAVLLTGSELPPAILDACHARGVPILLADGRMSADQVSKWRRKGRMAASLLSRVGAVLAQDGDSAARFRRLGEPALSVVVSGAIEPISEPLTCNESEREALGALVRARPVWLAAGCTPEDEGAVLAAHARASQFAHRMLLIVAPADPARGPALAARAAAEGWEVALRSREQEPEDPVQVYIADGEGELGLWYRLAPVSFMGGTLHAGSVGRSPFEPAALGSAILYGPNSEPQQAAYARLNAAGAVRQVSGEAELADALIDLINADKAATLAHNAWQVSSGGAGATELVMRALLDALDGVPSQRKAV